MQSTYLETTKNVYKKAAEKPQKGLCCPTTPVWQLPGLSMAKRMLKMNYGCGSKVKVYLPVKQPYIMDKTPALTIQKGMFCYLISQWLFAIKQQAHGQTCCTMIYVFPAVLTSTMAVGAVNKH